MTTVDTHRSVELPLAITCPSWCDESPEHHLRELPNIECTLIHVMAPAVIVDAEGFKPWGGKRRHEHDVNVWMSVATGLDLRETEPPVLFINDRTMTVTQALELADEIHRQVRLYRSTGGAA